MSLPVPVCIACGTAAWPPRALCPRCGHGEWREQPVVSGVVAGVTERDGTRVAEVRTPLGPLVLVRLVGEARAGDAVSLGLADGAPTASARPRPPRGPTSAP